MDAMSILVNEHAQVKELKAMIEKREKTIRTAERKHSALATRAEARARALQDDILELKRQLQNLFPSSEFEGGPYSALSLPLLRGCAASKPLWQVSQLSPAYDQIRKSTLAINKNLLDHGVRTNSDVVSRLEESPGLSSAAWVRRLHYLGDGPENYQSISKTISTRKGNIKNLQMAYRLAYALDLDIDVEPEDDCWGAWRDVFERKPSAEDDPEEEDNE